MNPEEPYSAYTATEEACRLCFNVADLKGYLPQNPRALILGTHGFPKTGRSLLPVTDFPEHLREYVFGTPDEIESILFDIWQSRNRYAMVLASYELHHCDHEQLTRVSELIGDITSHVHLFLDYTLKGKSETEVEPSITSQNECQRIQVYGGFQNWFRNHNAFSTSDLTFSLSQGNYDSLYTKQVSPLRMMAFGQKGLTASEASKMTI